MPELNAQQVSIRVIERLKIMRLEVTPQGRSAILSDAVTFFGRNVQELRRLYNDQDLEREIDSYVKYAVQVVTKRRGPPILDDSIVKEIRASCGSHRYGC